MTTTNGSTTATWADKLFLAFGPARATEAYKALAEALDPANNGGDAVMFAELCAAYRRYQALDIAPAGDSDEELFRELRDAYEHYTDERTTP